MYEVVYDSRFSFSYSVCFGVCLSCTLVTSSMAYLVLADAVLLTILQQSTVVFLPLFSFQIFQLLVPRISQCLSANFLCQESSSISRFSKTVIGQLHSTHDKETSFVTILYRSFSQLIEVYSLERSSAVETLQLPLSDSKIEIVQTELYVLGQKICISLCVCVYN